jgi:hypothetical protein
LWKWASVLLATMTLALSGVLNAGPLPAANADPILEVNLKVTKINMGQLSDDEDGYNPNLIDNTGELYTPKTGQAIDGSASFTLYKLNNTAGTKTQNDEPVRFSDEMFNDLIRLIEWGNFQNLPVAHGDTQAVIPALDVTKFKDAKFREYLNVLAGHDPTANSAIHIAQAADQDPTKAFNSFVLLLMEKFSTPDASSKLSYSTKPLGSTSQSVTTFGGLANDSRYLLVETTADLSGARQISTPMLLDLPLLRPDGSDVADPSHNIYIYPKTEFPTGGVEFVKTDGTGAALEGAKFALFRFNEIPVEHGEGLIASFETYTQGLLDVVKDEDDEEGDAYSIAGAYEGTLTQMVTADAVDGLYVSDDYGFVSATGLAKGRYFFVEYKTADDGYSLNRNPIYFTINDGNATGGDSKTAAIASQSALLPVDIDAETTLDIGFPNYGKQDITLTQRPVKDSIPGAEITAGGTDYNGFTQLDYTLAATINNPQVMLEGMYATFYSIFTSQNLGTWNYNTYFGLSPELGSSGYHMLDVRDIFGSPVAGFTPYPDDVEISGGDGGFFYDEASQATQATWLPGHDSSELRDVINPVLTVTANGQVFYYSGANSTDQVDSTDGAYVPEATKIGAFWDDYDSNNIGIARVGWYDDPLDPSSFENGTPTGTQFVFAVNVEKLLADLSDPSRLGPGAESTITNIRLDYRLTPDPEIFTKGMLINQFAQFEWGGGSDETNIVTSQRTLAIGGNNILKVDNEATPLGDAEFEIFKYGTGDNSDQRYCVVAANPANGNPIVNNAGANALTSLQQVFGWHAMSGNVKEPANCTTFVSTREIRETVVDESTGDEEDEDGDEDEPQGESPSPSPSPSPATEETVVTNATQIGIITLRGLNPEPTYYLLETKTPVDSDGKNYRNIDAPQPFRAVAQDLHGSLESHLEPSAANPQVHVPAPARRLGIDESVKHVAGTAALTASLVGTDTTAASPVVTTLVVNTKIAPFPVTGGIGSLIFLALGGSLIFFAWRRRQSEEDATE